MDRLPGTRILTWVVAFAKSVLLGCPPSFPVARGVVARRPLEPRRFYRGSSAPDDYPGGQDMRRADLEKSEPDAESAGYCGHQKCASGVGEEDILHDQAEGENHACPLPYLTVATKEIKEKRDRQDQIDSVDRRVRGGPHRSTAG